MDTLNSAYVDVVCLGDSMTDNETTGVLACEFWPAQCQQIFKDTLGINKVLWRNLGISGDKSSQVLARCHGAFQYRDGGTEADPTYNTPTLAFVACGVNDIGVVSAAVTQATIEAIVRCLLNRVEGVVATEASLPNTWQDDFVVPIGTRFWVITDGSTTGGIADAATPDLFDLPARVAGAIASVRPPTATSSGAVWIKAYHAAGTAGWKRIADDYTRGVSYVMVLSCNYRHDETPSVTDSYVAAIRAAQAAAVTALQGITGIGTDRCSFGDTWQEFRNDDTAGYLTIANLVYTAGDNHYNASGFGLVATKVCKFLNTVIVPGTSQTFPEYWLALP